VRPPYQSLIQKNRLSARFSNGDFAQVVPRCKVAVKDGSRVLKPANTISPMMDWSESSNVSIG
jgi:hypothetical protein